MAGIAYEAVTDSADSNAIKEKFASDAHPTTIDAPTPEKRVAKRKSDEIKVKSSTSKPKKSPQS